MQKQFFLNQVVPVGLTVIVCGILIGLLYGEIKLLNLGTATDITTHIRTTDILLGLTIYLKTSIDFAIFIGKLMDTYPTWKNRVAIEIGTGLGNAAGTMLILAVWAFFKEVTWLLVIMIFIAALVLLKLAEESLEHAHHHSDRKPSIFDKVVAITEKVLGTFNALVAPALRYVIPSLSVSSAKKTTFWALFLASFTVPFILGLDDFAGYVSLFNIVNVFGFAIGVFVGHMILNIFLYISPKHTIAAVKNKYISFIGAFAFIIIAIWGFVEIVHIIGR
jgi:hypothetical protein